MAQETVRNVHPGASRIAVYTHDTFGLGHVRRCLRIVATLSKQAPDCSILFITGSPALHLLDALPANADFLRIPTMPARSSSGTGRPHLQIGRAEVSLLRSDLVERAITSFSPDLFLVDNFPLGTQRELLPALQAARARGVRTVLGLRDVVDAPEDVRSDWGRQGIYEAIERYYDRILVYGVREVLDHAKAYAFSPTLTARVRYCGYIVGGQGLKRNAAEVRSDLGIEGKFLLATAGGGGDGSPLLRAVVEAADSLPRLPIVLVTGPLMRAEEVAELRQLAASNPEIRIHEYLDDLPSVLAAAELVIGMGGYNTIAEIIGVRARAVIVPRSWNYGGHKERTRKRPKAEQVFRARALADLGLLAYLDPDQLTSQSLAAAIEQALSKPPPEPSEMIDLGGRDRVVRHLLELLGQREDDDG